MDFQAQQAAFIALKERHRDFVAQVMTPYFSEENTVSPTLEGLCRLHLDRLPADPMDDEGLADSITRINVIYAETMPLLAAAQTERCTLLLKNAKAISDQADAYTAPLKGVFSPENNAVLSHLRRAFISVTQSAEFTEEQLETTINTMQQMGLSTDEALLQMQTMTQVADDFSLAALPPVERAQYTNIFQHEYIAGQQKIAELFLGNIEVEFAFFAVFCAHADQFEKHGSTLPQTLEGIEAYFGGRMTPFKDVLRDMEATFLAVTSIASQDMKHRPTN